MKKTYILAALLAAVAMASHGGNVLLAHAQTATTDTATPSNTAALQQQLDDAKAQLIYLEQQEGQIPAGDTGSATQPASATVMPSAPATELSTSDISSMQTALAALANMLVSLQAKVAQDPQFASSNGTVVVSSLQDIGQTLALIGNEVNGNNLAMANPAAAMPSAPAANNATAMTGTGSTGGSTGAATAAPTQVAQTNPTAPAAMETSSVAIGAMTSTVPNTAANVAPQTAQASSAFSFAKLNWPLIVVIILIIAAIAIWLWWDDSEDKQPTVKTVSSGPQRPMPQASQPAKPIVMNSSNNGNQGNAANRQQPASSQTPLSSAVAPHGNQ